LSDGRGTVLLVTDRLCKDCDGVVAPVPDVHDDWDLDLMCVICGAALSLGGLLLGELEARDDLLAFDVA
jgi:hypothetical protein